MSKHISKYWGDRDIQTIIGGMLRIGVLSSAIVVGIGGLLYLIQNGWDALSVRGKYTATAERFTDFSQVWHGIIALQPLAIIQFGIILLIATPVLRVLFSFIAFWIEKDYLYVVITLIVLSIIITSMLGGIAG